MSDDNVQVALRIRPLVQTERDRGCQAAVERVPNAQQVIVNRNDTFTYNYVFDCDDTQESVYDKTVSPMLHKLLSGFNATILAYGQTGSGKTHTMGTAYDGQLNDNVGIIPRAMRDIFEKCEKLAGEFEFVLTCSFMELYQEQLYDLLSVKTRDESVVELRENKAGNIIIPDLTEVTVRTALETFDCLVRGSSGRAVASTSMNQQSSRSHAIFTLTIEATKKKEVKTVTTSKFHLVDLAGSERSKKTQATGDRFKEGVKINQGLLALGNVISALGSGQGQGFVRYRDSKLTRLLQDSLGGNSITLMIACISPADYNVAETLSTLRYADRARKIKNKPIVNQDPHIAEINHLKGIIQKLRIELLAGGGNMTASLTGALQQVPSLDMNKTCDPQLVTSSKAYQQLQEKYHNLQRQFQATLHDVAENEMRAHIIEAAHEKLKEKTVKMKNIVDYLSRNIREDSSGEDLKVCIESVREIQGLVDALDDEFVRTETEMTDHKRQYTISDSGGAGDRGDEPAEGADVDGETSLEVHSLMQEQTDAYTNKQIDIKDQLRRINRELNLKEELQQRIAGNLSKFYSLDDNMDEKFRECEEKIKELEAEKAQLVDKLKHVKENASAKLAEERRKRLQALEHEITSMKRTNMQQAKLLKVREKETQKIKNLGGEIQTIKESKVRLIRTMRQESENFRQWKLTREKELMQLKNKDRKLQNEMARKEALHTKQRNVLKRKCEEAIAINKRLKDALDRQKVAQTQRQKNQSSKESNVATNKIDQIIAWVAQELEVIMSLIDAEQSLEQLMEDRGLISNRIGELKRLQPLQNDTDHPSADELTEELASLQEEVEMRNAQIIDLQQKVCVADLPTRIASLCEGIQGLGDARAVLKYLLKSISDMRREYANRSLEQKASLSEMLTAREAAEKRCDSMARRIRLIELAHEDAIAERENMYEEKVAVLLRELHNQQPQLMSADNTAILTPEQEERLKIQEEQLNKMEGLRDELTYYKQMVADLKKSVKKYDTFKANKPTADVKLEKPHVKREIIVDSDLDDIDEEFNASDDNDPDWILTPIVRAKRGKRSYTKASNSSDVSSVSNNQLNETYVQNPMNRTEGGDANVTAAVAAGESANTSGAGANKRKSKGCSCSSHCRSKRCGCRANAQKCSVRCRCVGCTNDKDENDDNDNGDGENETTSEVDDKENVFKSPEKVDSLPLKRKDNPHFLNAFDSTTLTPKVARTSILNLEPKSAKKKFYE